MARVIVVGAGPAGASLAVVLADRGVEVTLIERQRDFAREFRGEVLLPSGLDALEQLGLSSTLASVPRARPEALDIYLNRRHLVHVEASAADFGGRLPAPVSQPALLEAIVAEGEKRPAFRFVRGASVRDLLRENGRVVGVRASHEGAEPELRADLVIGADGRASVVRRRGGFEARAQDVPMDVVWCKVPPFDPIRGARVYLGRGHLLIAYRAWDERIQVAWAILKGTFGELRRQGIEHWVRDMADHVSDDFARHLLASAGALQHPFLLDCQADRVTRWSAPGVLLLGDAAHVMSPVGGQGLNIALRDVIAAANELVPVLRETALPSAIDAACARVEAARLPELRWIQRRQALPPRIVLQRAWWGEPVRRGLGRLVSTGLGQRLAAAGAGPFLFGIDGPRLRV
jgi:2-polyprenyl-6-methoxyphenol hydroxylase-like FAD-dependent oxidoreductase